jgi:hypothetical protein
MRLLFAGLIAACGLFAGGVANAALVSSTAVANWTVQSPGNPATPGAVLMTSTPSTYGSLFGFTSGVANGWLSNNANGLTSSTLGPYFFRQTFNAVGGDNISANLTMLHDNGAVVRFNGFTVHTSAEEVGYAVPDTFAFVRPTQAGINTLEIEVQNFAGLGQINPVGVSLRVNSSRLEPIPEPASIVLWACAGGLGLLVRRRMSRSA